MPSKKIAKQFREDPTKLDAALLKLIETYATKAEQARAEAPNLVADGHQIASVYFDGVSEGFNKAWKLVFGHESQRDLME